MGDAPRRPYLLGRAGVWGEGCLLPRPFCYAPCGVAGALPHPVTLSAVKFANRPCARLAEALREAGRLAAAQGGVAPLHRGVAPLRPYDMVGRGFRCFACASMTAPFLSPRNSS